MKFRKCDWIDTKTDEVKYSYQVQTKPLGTWYHVMDGKNACIYDTKKERDKWLAIHKAAKI